MPLFFFLYYYFGFFLYFSVFEPPLIRYRNSLDFLFYFLPIYCGSKTKVAISSKAKSESHDKIVVDDYSSSLRCRFVAVAFCQTKTPHHPPIIIIHSILPLNRKMRWITPRAWISASIHSPLPRLARKLRAGNCRKLELDIFIFSPFFLNFSGYPFVTGFYAFSFFFVFLFCTLLKISGYPLHAHIAWILYERKKKQQMQLQKGISWSAYGRYRYIDYI